MTPKRRTLIGLGVTEMTQPVHEVSLMSEDRALVLAQAARM